MYPASRLDITGCVADGKAVFDHTVICGKSLQGDLAINSRRETPVSLFEFIKGLEKGSKEVGL